MNNDLLTRISALAARQLEMELDVIAAEQALKNKQAALRQLSQVDLPELMAEAELRSITLKSGAKVEVRDEFACAVTIENRPSAMAWLREHKFGGIIKTSVEVKFATGKLSDAEKLAAQLSKKGLPAVVNDSVHPQTLKAFIRERRAANGVVPPDLFGIHNYTITKITEAPK